MKNISKNELEKLNKKIATKEDEVKELTQRVWIEPNLC